MKTGKQTTQPIELSNITGIEPEFVRIPNVQQLAGIKRGLCYRKIADGTFKSILLREPGNKQGIRLIYWPSVRAYLHGLMKEQSRQAA